MSALIDESVAWNLVRAVTAEVAKSSTLRTRHDPRPDVWLQVHAAGDWVTSHDVTDEARQLIELYLPLQLQADLVIAQIGQSLDGRIATEQGHSHYITGPADIQRLHRLRAIVDAVIVGASTVAADNPRLTVRNVEGPNPVRVVLDPDGRLEPERHVFADRATRTLVVRRAPDNHVSTQGDVLFLPILGEDGFEPAAILAALRGEGYRRVLIEGGGITLSRFIQAGVVDRLHVTVAPLLIGSGRQALTLPPIETLDQALRPRCRTFRLGDDVLFDLDLRRMESAGVSSPPS